MKELSHKEWATKGGVALWKGKSKEERSKIMKDRWAIRKMNKEIKEVLKAK